METEHYLKEYSYAVKDVFYLIALQGISYIIPLLVWPYLMVTLGAEAFGILGFALSFCQFLTLIVDYGFNITATRKVALSENQNELNRIVAETMSTKILLLLLTALIVLGFVAIPKFTPYRIAVFLMFGMVLGNTFTLQWLYQGLKKIRIVSIVIALCRILIFPLTFWLVKSADHLYLAIAIQSATYLLSGLIMVLITWRKRIASYCKPSWKAICFNLKDSLPIFVSTATSSIYAMLFIVILGYCVSPDEVGRYSAVEKVMRVGCYTILMPTLQAFYPRISQIAQQDKTEAQRFIRIITCILETVMFLFGIALFFGAPYLTTFLGKDYEGTERLFKIMAFIPMLISLGGINGQLGLMAVGKDGDKQMFRNVYIAAATIALIAIGLSAPFLSAYIAAGILLAVEAFVAIGMTYFYYRK